MKHATHKLLAVLVFGLAGLQFGYAQEMDTLTFKRLNDTLQLSQTNIVPFSDVLVAGQDTIQNTQVGIDYYGGKVWLKDSALVGQAVVLGYQSFDQAAEDAIALRTSKPINPEDTMSQYDLAVLEEIRRNEAAEKTFDTFQFSDLESSGSLSRAITVGSGRDLGVNSDFRLQLNGKLSDDMEILAAITDQNIPIQPSGTTQQINDFDQVFIKLKRDPFVATFGDYEVIQKNTRFGNIYRNVLGGRLQAIGEKHQAGVSFSVAKGKFQSNTFVGENNKQGPYRLTGQNGERFIIILAGSERVYVNGRLMQRGEDRDYIIDYNLGELTFTAKQIITANTRIVIDFEYSDRNYSRSLIFSDYTGQALNDKLKVRVSYGREADNPNAPIDLELGQNERDALAAAGDDAFAATVPGFDTSAYNQGDIFYRLTDTLANGTAYDSVFVYTEDSTGALYRLTFSNVGAGNGNYVQANSLVNGNVFTWVTPDENGNPQGSYTPLKVLPLPRQLQVLNTGIEYAITKHLKFENELSVSSEDRNRLSDFDDGDNTDIATRTTLSVNDLPMGSAVKFSTHASFQYVGERYQNFDRVYQKEYGRVWNFDDLGQRATERLGEGGVALKFWDRITLAANGGYRLMGDSLSTIRQEYTFDSKDSTVLMGQYKFVHLNTENTGTGARSRWMRHNGDVFHPLGKQWAIGAEIWMEDREEIRSDSLSNGSFEFYDFSPYIRKIGEKFDATVKFNYRTDKSFFQNTYRAKSRNWGPSMNLNWQPTRTLRLQSTANYQNFTLLDTTFREAGLQTEETFLGNLQLAYSTRNRALRLNAIYEVLSEQAARRQSVYVEVNPGQGQYEWKDYDDDGVQDLDEFQISNNPLTANFVQVLSPTSELFPAVGVKTGGNLQLDLRNVIDRSRTGFLAFVRNISAQTAVRMRQQRLRSGQLSDYALQLESEGSTDTSLVTAQLNIKQNLWFYRNSRTAEVGFKLIDNRNRQFLQSGTENGRRRSYTSNQRYNFNSKRNLENLLEFGTNNNDAEVLNERDYDITYWRVLPKMNFMVNRKFRFSVGYEYQWKENVIDTVINAEAAQRRNSKLNSHKIILDARLNLKGKNNIFGKVEVFRIDQNGEPNTNANFILLEGMQNGNNAIWNLYLTYYVTEFLEMSIIYDGRASQEIPVRHSARMQLRAIF